jgi:hypothetical protein
VVGFQIILVYLIAYYYKKNNQIKWKIEPAQDFTDVIARLICSIMMHLLVEPGYRNGIQMMKYVVNHPEKFRVHPKSDE